MQLTKTFGSKRPAFDWFIIISCVLLKNLVSLYYQRNYEPLQYHGLNLLKDNTRDVHYNV